jgi:hypothetical protein
MERNKNEQHEQQSQQQNSTINNPGSKLPGYGNTTDKTIEELERKHGKDSRRQGNSSIPLDEDETIGIP